MIPEALQPLVAMLVGAALWYCLSKIVQHTSGEPTIGVWLVHRIGRRR